jgi:hypothetical protein
MDAAEEQHDLRPGGEGSGIEIVLWTDDTDVTVNCSSALALKSRETRVVQPAKRTDDRRRRA